MKKQSLFILITLLLVHMSASLFAANKAEPPRSDIDEIKTKISNRVDLLNDIIKYPESANMQNWSLLGNPHDETELSFYMNSISNGSSSAYSKNSITSQKLINHSQSNSKSEPSVLLQHLRLSLMAFNIRPGDSVPVIKITKITQANNQSKEFVIEGAFIANNALGQSTPYQTRIVFEIDDSTASAQKGPSIALQKIVIGGQVIYGWWHGLQSNDK